MAVGRSSTYESSCVQAFITDHVVAIIIMPWYGRSLCLPYLALVSFVTVLCPIWLLLLQRYRIEINGPWDEARVEQYD